MASTNPYPLPRERKLIGNERGTVHGDLGSDDDRDDVPYGSSDDPHVYDGVRWQEAKVSGLCPDLGLRQCLSARLVVVRGGGIPSRCRDRAAGRTVHVAHGKRCSPRWGGPAGGRSVSTLTPEGYLPVEMPHACAIHSELLA